MSRLHVAPLALLVVLSACETALGKRLDGEGMMGLSRAFLAAGASGVVATLWSVDDAATAHFMKVFYGMYYDALQGIRVSSLWKTHFNGPPAKGIEPSSSSRQVGHYQHGNHA